MRLPAWHPHPDVWLLIVALGGAYALAVRRRDAPGGAATRRQTLLFGLGLLTLWVAADWPIHDLSERYLYSVHMLQHLLFTLVAPPLLIAGTPAWMLRRLLAPRPVAAAARVLTRPLVALLLFNGVLLFTHWVVVVESSVRSEPVHFAVHALVVSSALVMWWPVVSPLPELPAISPPAQMLYLFLQSLAPTVPASFLTFGHTPLYAIYATFPRIWGISALTDQLLAGLLMKIAGGLILWAVITVVFFRWHSQEEREGWDPLRWHQVERDIRAGLSKR